jgi:hypothetical protein
MKFGKALDLCYKVPPPSESQAIIGELNCSQME